MTTMVEAIQVSNYEDLVDKSIEKNSQCWTIKEYITQGGFGKIFNIDKHGDRKQYIIKIESKNSGPLFCEFYFYKRMQKNKDQINIPTLIEHGLNISINGIKQRNIILPKFNYTLTEFQNLYINKLYIKKFSLRIIDTLEFINNLLYTHGDIKPSNIVFDSFTEPYIIDFGLATNFEKSKYKKDKKNIMGSLEYMSIDSHNGIISQKTDLCAFGFILYELLEKKRLPWYNKKRFILVAKNNFIESKKEKKDFIGEYYNILDKSSYDSKPDFSCIKQLINQL